MSLLALLIAFLPAPSLISMAVEPPASVPPERFRLGVVGLVHAHVYMFLENSTKRTDLQIVGVAEPRGELRRRYGGRHQFAESILFSDLDQMLDKTRPQAVAVFTDIRDHRSVVAACAKRGVHVMLEKPPAVSLADAQAMEKDARQAGIHVLVNYETTWYANTTAAYNIVRRERRLGEIHRIVVNAGHQGPKEIGMPREFLEFLTDPDRNGAGALYDFGCYGANLVAYLMDGRRPNSVTAVTSRLKSDPLYSRVDDEATIVLAYPDAQAVIQASWNWPESRKDMEIYGRNGSLTTLGWEAYQMRGGPDSGKTQHASAPAAPANDPISYLIAASTGQIKPDGPSCLALNMVTAEILDAARRSAAEGRTVHLAPAPASAPASAPAAAGQGTLSVVVVDDTQKDAPVGYRAWVDMGGKRKYGPQTASCTPYGGDESFSCTGPFEMKLPAGKGVLHIERGKEYRPIDQEILIEDEKTLELTVHLRRWVHMTEEGWYSADMHCHFGNHNPVVLKQLGLADDVNFQPSITYWNKYEKEWPAWPEGPNISVDPTHLVTRRNGEIERIGGEPFESVGALLLFGLKRPIFVDQPEHTFPTDADFARMARESSPHCVIDTDKPIWAENVVTMALGLFDSVQVCHNHYHRRQTNNQGGPCCGMAGTQIEDQPVDYAGNELMLRTNATYYRWLNCGFRLSVTGGSAMGVMKLPLGYNRTYARLDGPLSEENYLKAVRAGRTFATSGPMLTLAVDGRKVGSIIEVSSDAPRTLNAIAHLRSIEPIDALELVHDGSVVRRVDLSQRPVGEMLDEKLSLELRPARSGWVAARAMYRNAFDGHFRQAHTSPIYISVDGKPTASRRDAEFMIRWVDEILKVSDKPDRYKTPEQRTAAQKQFHEARGIYDRIARTAAQVWND